MKMVHICDVKRNTIFKFMISHCVANELRQIDEFELFHGGREDTKPIISKHQNRFFPNLR